MAEKKRRIHNLAKEFQVDSSVIIEKCRAEGIDVKNHMHVVSAGLEATIREWFSEGIHATAVEEASPVDLKVVRRKPRRKKAEEVAETPPSGEAATATLEPVPVTASTAPAEPPVSEPVAKAPRRKTAAAPPAEPLASPAPETISEASPTVPPPVAAEVAPAAAAAAAAPAVEEATASRPPASQAVEPSSEPPRAESVPAKPAVAGPQNIPEPAKLTGPKVIRFDRPEYVDRPRPARPLRPIARGPQSVGVPPDVAQTADEEERRARGRGGPRRGPAETASPRRGSPRRTIRDVQEVINEKFREWRDRDLIERRERLDQASGRGIGGLRAIEGKQGSRRPSQRLPAAAVRREKIELTEPIIIKDFSRETGITVAEIQKRLMQDNILANINSAIDAERAQLIAADYGIELIVLKAKTGYEKLADEFAALPRKNLAPRSPVVTVLGHVDHGKTSLLDRIRAANVAAGEAGGITQHIGAYRVRVGDKWVTFLDTPGHAAFTAMRARGAHMTDVVVLVVAADDGVMPTTVEAINHARAANSTIVVALNKIDLPHDINKLYGQLSEHGLTPSGEWGGNTDVIKTSAVTGEGIAELLEHLATLSDLMDLKADPTIPATGTVIESERSGAKGCVARVMVQEGTLKTGDVIVCGPAHGRVRSLRDDRGKTVNKAGPSTPVEIAGLSDVPLAGDRFYVLDSARRAKEIAEELAAKRRELELVQISKPTSLESLMATAAEGEVPELRVILRADVQGSVDVLRKTLAELPTDQVKLNVLHAGVGTITESDVVLAQASRAIIVGFHVVPDPVVARMADNVGVDIRTYRVIYNLMDDIRAALEGLLAPEEKIELRGRAEVREVFNITRVGRIAGCVVRDGLIHRGHLIRVVRDGVVVKDGGVLESLRRFKDDVKEVRNGLECGLRIQGFDDVKPGDMIESYERTQVAKTLG